MQALPVSNEEDHGKEKSQSVHKAAKRAGTPEKSNREDGQAPG
jgi:hypothetical protein